MWKVPLASETTACDGNLKIIHIQFSFLFDCVVLAVPISICSTNPNQNRRVGVVAHSIDS